MASNQGSADPTAGGTETNPAQTVAEGKGKGKGKGKADPTQDVSMGEEDSSSDEETGAEDEVWSTAFTAPMLQNSIADIFRSQTKDERMSNCLHFTSNHASS